MCFIIAQKILKYTQARNIVEHVKSSPYKQALTNAKRRHPASIEKLERLLDRADTPHPTELVDALLAITTDSLAAEESLLQEKSAAHGLHTIGDVLQRSLKKLRAYIKAQTKKNITRFVREWSLKSGGTRGSRSLRGARENDNFIVYWPFMFFECDELWSVVDVDIVEIIGRIETYDTRCSD
jgi:hypothetical protein